MSRSNNIFRILIVFLFLLLFLGLIACDGADKKAAKDVDDAITAIAEVILDNEDAIVEARAAYDGLTDKQKELVTKLTELESKEAELAILLEVKAVVDLIAALPANVTLAAKEQLLQAYTAYDTLAADLKSKVTNYQKLQSAKETYDLLKAAQDRIDAVVGLITLLPSADNVTLDDEDAVNEANEAFEALSSAERGKVTNAAKLLGLLAKLADLGVARDNLLAAEAVDELIAALGDDITGADDVEAARDAYESLNEDQKALVQYLSLLEAAEATIANLQRVQAVVELIIALPSEPVLADEPQFLVARTAYDNLDEDLQALVTNYGDLVVKEVALEAARVMHDITYELNEGFWEWTSGAVTNPADGIAADSNLPVILMQDIYVWLRDNDLLNSDVVDPNLRKLTWADFSADYTDPYAIYNWAAYKDDGGFISDVAGYNQFFYTSGSGNANTGEITKLVGGFFGSEEYGPKYHTLVQHLSYLVFDRNYNETTKLFWSGPGAKSAAGFILDGFLYGTQGLSGRSDFFIAFRGIIPTPSRGYTFYSDELSFYEYDFLVDKKAFGAEAYLSVPSRIGYFFEGWYDNPDCTGERIVKVPAREVPAEKYYAKWVPVG